jgi:nucleoside-diphosphate-sugar epimerase
MKALFIGGTGCISSAVSRLAVEQGFDLYLLNRGNRNSFVPEGAKVVTGDISNVDWMKEYLRDQYFDIVIDFIVFEPEQAKRDIGLFAGKTSQYIFISTVATYQRPVGYYLVDESTPQCNPYWDYAINKISCEELYRKEYRENGFPLTIIRPSHTYSEANIPFVMNSFSKPWSLIDRLLKNKPIIVPGDGTSLWTLTHNSDIAKGIVGLMGNVQAIGQTFHITSDEVKTWDQYLQVMAQAVGVKPVIKHLSSEMICTIAPDLKPGLIGDQCNSFVVDNSKIKRFVPGYQATMPFERGIRKSIDYFKKHPELQRIDEEWNAKMDRMVAAYDEFIAKAAQ